MANETTVFVPVDNVDGVGLRRAICDDEVERLFGLLGDGNIDSHQNWKGRFKDNSDRMRTGSIYDVVEVLKSLTFLAKSKSLSFREKRMLDRAKFLVVSEITEVLALKTPEVEERVDVALEECFATKARNAGKPKVKAAVPEPVVAATPAPAPVAAPVAVPQPARVASAVSPKAAPAPVKAPAKVAVAVKVAPKPASKVKTPVKRAVKKAAPARVKATARAKAGKVVAAPRRAARAS
jgi:CarD family transcriptional regulator